MVVIPGGNFMMGSGQDKVEQPIQSVTLKSFAAGRHAVTKVQFAAFVQAKGYVTEAEQGDGCLGWTGSTWKRDRMYNWRNVSFSQADDHPVVCVSWNDAKAYTQWISQVTAKQYRLLSESEREYATRAATTGKYWWGDTASRDHANYGTDQCCRPYEGKFTTPVGKYSANAFGLFDMSGNSWDWIEDWYHDNYNGAPTDGSAWISGGEQKYRVLRGGSWINIPAGLRSSIRIGDTPGSRSGDIGFRLGRTLFTP
jgi:formylglycine-generating enzyme required for sulfatase activity